MKYNIGDRVIITKSGSTFDAYTEKFLELGFKNTRHNFLGDGTEGIVFALSTHDNQQTNLVAIRADDGKESLLMEVAVELISPAIFNPEIY